MPSFPIGGFHDTFFKMSSARFWKCSSSTQSIKFCPKTLSSSSVSCSYEMIPNRNRSSLGSNLRSSSNCTRQSFWTTSAWSLPLQRSSGSSFSQSTKRNSVRSRPQIIIERRNLNLERRIWGIPHSELLNPHFGCPVSSPSLSASGRSDEIERKRTDRRPLRQPDITNDWMTRVQERLPAWGLRKKRNSAVFVLNYLEYECFRTKYCSL